MDFLDYALSLSPSVLSIPLAGHLNNYDSYGRTVTVSGSPDWVRTSKGFGFHPRSNGLYYIAHNTEQIASEQTIFAFYNNLVWPYDTVYQNLVSKRSGAGSYYMFGIDDDGAGNTRVRLYDGSSFYRLTTDVNNSKSLTVNLQSGVASKTYVDGIYKGVIPAGTYSSANVQINVGATYTQLNTFTCAPIQCVAIFPSTLTAEQIANLHNYFENARIGYEPKKKIYIPSEDTKGAVIDLYGAPKSGNIIADHTNTGNNGTVSDNITVSNGIDIELHFQGKGDGIITINSDSSWHSKDYNTYVLDITVNGNGEGGSGRILEKQTGASSYLSILCSGGDIYLSQSFSIATAQWRFPYTAGRKEQITIVQDRTSPLVAPKIFRNGTEITPTSVLVGNGVVTTDATANIVFGNRPGMDREGDYNLSRFKFYPSQLSDADVRSEYVDFATKHVINHTPRFEHPVDLAAVSAPGKAGPVRVESGGGGGDGQWVNTLTESYLQCTSAFRPQFLIKSSQAYGAWYYEFTPSSTASSLHYLHFMATEILSLSANQKGYGVWWNNTNLQLSLTRDNGVALNSTGTGAFTLNTKYQVFITRRRTDGEIKVNLRGGTQYIVWTQVLTATHNTNITSNFMNFSCPFVGSKFGNVITWPYGDSLLPNDIDFLKD